METLETRSLKKKKNEEKMNTDIFEGNWRQFKGQIQKKWGKLTDDKLDQINGDRERFLGILQENYGIARDKAEDQLKEMESSTAQ